MKNLFCALALALVATFACVSGIDQTLGVPEETIAFQGELFAVPAEITKLEVNREDYGSDVWYGVYTPSTPAGFTEFIQSADGTINSVRIVVNDHTVYEWTSKPANLGQNSIKIELKDWKDFFEKDVLSRMK